MPKVIPMISDEIVLRELSTLDGAILLIPRQVAMIFGISDRQLEEDRNIGRPPPFVKRDGINGAIRYRVEDVRKALADLTVYRTTTQANADKPKRRTKQKPYGILRGIEEWGQ